MARARAEGSLAAQDRPDRRQRLRVLGDRDQQPAQVIAKDPFVLIPGGLQRGEGGGMLRQVIQAAAG